MRVEELTFMGNMASKASPRDAADSELLPLLEAALNALKMTITGLQTKETWGPLLVAIMPSPRVHLVRYGGCVAPHSTLRDAIIPTPRQQGVDGEEKKTGTPYWDWARLLGRVVDLNMATYPFCRRGSLRIIAAITHESVITRILRHLKLASVTPPIAPARCRQEIFAFD